MLSSQTVRVAGAFMLALSLVGAGFALAAPAAPPAKGDAAKGKVKFNTTCIACHKVDGTGGVKLTGNPTPNWKDPKTWADPKRKNMDAYLRDCITNGKSASGMVAWGKSGQIKPAQIEDLIAYIHVLAGKK
jgi:mono/diheme cytochrome c family protein